MIMTAAGKAPRNTWESRPLTNRIRTAPVGSCWKCAKPIYSRHVIDGLRDIRARARIQVRIERLIAGNEGDVTPVGAGVSELRIDYGPGYRVYFKKEKQRLVILLACGDKSTQKRDIKTALRLARNLEEHSL